jgi:hypothetical protein
MSATDGAMMALFKKIAKVTGQPEADLEREFKADATAFGDKYYEHMTPEEMKLFG